MKKRVINFGDNRLFGGVGEWGLVLTAWAGGMGKGVSSCLESLNSSYPSLPENPPIHTSWQIVLALANHSRILNIASVFQI